MSNKFHSFLLIIISLSLSCNNHDVVNNASKNTCDDISNKNAYLYLDGSYESLIDNGLRCFDLNSLSRWNESVTRIWRYDNYELNRNIIFRLKLFEFGNRSENNFAKYYSLEWIVENSGLKVVCIEKTEFVPKEGWEKFYNVLKAQKIDSLQNIPTDPNLPISTGFDLTFVQYLKPHVVHTVNLSNRSGNIRNSKDPREIGYINLLKQIYFSFGLKINSYKSGIDFIEYE